MKDPKIKSDQLQIFPIRESEGLLIPLIDAQISAGFPSPAADFIEQGIDLTKHLVRNPATTFIASVNGNSMTGAGIRNKDWLIIDKSLPAADGKIAVCVIDGEFTLKRLRVIGKELYLVAENEKYPAIKVTEFQEFEIWGIVTFSIQQH